MPEFEIRADEPADREIRRLLRRAPGFRTRDGGRMHLQWMPRSL